MRDAFASEITTLATTDNRIVLITGDIGNHLWDDFRAKFPQRFFNAGIAEQHMVSFAAGLALAGFRPVVYAIASFATTRCLEQIRIDLCYHNLPVVVVGVGAGLSYAALGPTHHACEDIAMLRAMPNLKVVCPCDPVETRLALRAILRQDSPTYLRLGKAGELALNSHEKLKLGKFRILSLSMESAKDVGIIATGPIASVAVEVHRLLVGRGLNPWTVSAHTVKPLDTGFLSNTANHVRLFVTIEEHSLHGGLGSLVAEWKADNRVETPLLRFGTPDAFPGVVGGREQALAACGLTAENIAGKILEAM